MAGLRLDHIGIAVRNLLKSKTLWESILGVPSSPIETVPEEGVRIAWFELPNARIELLEPHGETSPLTGFLAKRGEGLHHLAFEVDDMTATLKRLRKANLQLLSDQPRIRGNNRKVLFVHPKAASGVLTEYVRHLL